MTPRTPIRVTIAFSDADRTVALAVSDRLAAYGLTVWLSDDAARAREAPQFEGSSAALRADVLVLIVTPLSAFGLDMRLLAGRFRGNLRPIIALVERAAATHWTGIEVARVVNYAQDDAGEIWQSRIAELVEAISGVAGQPPVGHADSSRADATGQVDDGVWIRTTAEGQPWLLTPVTDGVKHVCARARVLTESSAAAQGRFDLSFTPLVLALFRGTGPWVRWAQQIADEHGADVAALATRTRIAPSLAEGELAPRDLRGDERRPYYITRSVSQVLSRAETWAREQAIPVDVPHLWGVLLFEPGGHRDELAEWRIAGANWALALVGACEKLGHPSAPLWKRLCDEKFPAPASRPDGLPPSVAAILDAARAAATSEGASAVSVKHVFDALASYGPREVQRWIESADPARAKAAPDEQRQLA